MSIRDGARTAKVSALVLCAVAMGTEAHGLDSLPQAASPGWGLVLGLLVLGTMMAVSIVRRWRLARARARTGAPVVPRVSRTAEGI